MITSNQFYILEDFKKYLDFIDELNVGHKNFVRDFIEVCKADMLSTSFEDVEQERRRFNLNAEILRFAVDTLATIKAQDMPQFRQLEKNEISKQESDELGKMLNEIIIKLAKINF